MLESKNSAIPTSLALFMAFWPLWAFPHEAPKVIYPNIDANMIHQLDVISAEIALDCAPSHCLMVFVGRSLAVVPPCLSAHEIKNHVMLPISGLMQLKDKVLSSYRQGLAEHPLLKTWRQHFESQILDVHLKPVLNPSITKLKIIDFTSQGTSLVLNSIWMKKYLGDGIQVNALAYANSDSIQRNDLKRVWGDILQENGVQARYLAENHPEILGDERLEKEIRKFSVFENYAPYKKWTPYSSPELMLFFAMRDLDLSLSTPPVVDFEHGISVGENGHYASYRDLEKWFTKKDFPVLTKVVRDRCLQLIAKK